MNTPSSLRHRGLQLLRTALNDAAADFRDGQWESIEALVRRRARLLSVQRTGWGNSACDFLGAAAAAQSGSGTNAVGVAAVGADANQIDAAVRLGVRAETINSTNRDDWLAIEQRCAATKSMCWSCRRSASPMRRF